MRAPHHDSAPRLEMDLMDKVRQVSESYELNKYKALNKTIELDARLSNERLVATKLRLSQVSSLNDKLSKELRSMQQQFRQQEKKLLLTETMLNQLTKERATSSRILGASARFARLAASAATGPSHKSSNQVSSAKKAKKGGRDQALSLLAGKQRGTRLASSSPPLDGRLKVHQVSIQSAGTQTQVDAKSGGGGKTRTIISDLRQRLNLVGSLAKGLIDSNSNRASSLPSVFVHSPAPPPPADHLEQQVTATDSKWRPLMTTRPSSASQATARLAWGATNETTSSQVNLRDNNQRLQAAPADANLRRNSLDDIQTTVANSILAADEDCFVHELPNGQKIIISRGWPGSIPGESRRKSKTADRASNVDEYAGGTSRKLASGNGKLDCRLNEDERNRLLMEYLSRTGQKEAHRNNNHHHHLHNAQGKATHKRQEHQVSATVAVGGALKEAGGLDGTSFGSERLGLRAQQKQLKLGLSKTRAGVNNKAMIVQYELPVHRSDERIPLTSGC